MSSYAEANDVRPLDRLTNAIRRGLEAILPWFDPAEEETRRIETERVRRKSIAARLQVEEVARRYAKADKAMKRW